MNDLTALSLDGLIRELTRLTNSADKVVLDSKSTKVLITQLKRLRALTQKSALQEISTEQGRDGGTYRFAGVVVSREEAAEVLDIEWESHEVPDEGTLLYFRLYTQEELDTAAREAERMCAYLKTSDDVEG